MVLLALHYNDPSSNPKVFSVKFVCLKRTKTNKKRPGLTHFKKKNNSWMCRCLTKNLASCGIPGYLCEA